jgi:hypothetical protein
MPTEAHHLDQKFADHQSSPQFCFHTAFLSLTIRTSQVRDQVHPKCARADLIQELKELLFSALIIVPQVAQNL